MTEPRSTAEAVQRLEAVRDELMDRFNRWDGEFTPWALELLAIVETALVDARNGGSGSASDG